MASLYDLLAEMQATTPRMEGEPENSRPYIDIDLNQRLIKLTSFCFIFLRGNSLRQDFAAVDFLFYQEYL